MATIGSDPGGRRRVLFVAPDGRRRTVRLGKVDQRTSEAVCRHIEALLAARISGQPTPRETAVWLTSITPKLYDRLARAGLVEPRHEPGAVRLGRFIDEYLGHRRDLKAGTMEVMRRAGRNLLDSLGDVQLSSITPADGDRFRAAMLARGCAKSTINKWQRCARHFLEVARRRKLIAENPFAHLKGAVVGDPAKRVFVPGEDVLRVIDAAPDPQWKLLIALGRWGGLRIPSEALALKWSDVDWEHARFVVRSPKTAHHADGGIRIVPIFHELAGLFQVVFDEAAPGEEWVITRYRSPRANLRTQLVRYITAAGLRPWPKPWQNMRVSRATELVREYPSHVAAAWLGHTEAIADNFYRQVTEDDFKKAAQKTAQYLHAPSCTASHEPRSSGQKRGYATLCEAMQGGDRSPREPNTLQNPNEIDVSVRGGTESGTVGAGAEHPAGPGDPELPRLVEAWPGLPAEARRRIMAIVAEALLKGE